MSPMQYYQQQRLQLAAQLLRQGDQVQKYQKAVIFNAIDFFKAFKRQFGFTPSQFIDADYRAKSTFL